LSVLKKSADHTERSIGMVTTLGAIIAVLLFAGTILAPIQSSHAAPRKGGFFDTSSLKDDIRDGVNVNLEHRDQHMDQENLCFRSNTCRQSDVGQNTLGNDNSVTGFADQSDNLQQSAAPTTPTSGNKTTPTNTTLTVIKIVSGNTTATPSNFTMHVTGNNPTPANFEGSSTGIVVTLDPGPFSVTETASPNFTTSFSSNCGGTIRAGQHLSCTIINTPKTCEECFTSLLTPEQRIEVPNVFNATSIADLCTRLVQFQVGEEFLRANLPIFVPGISETTVNDLIACLKAAGLLG
jgi:hypothetical protein